MRILSEVVLTLINIVIYCKSKELPQLEYQNQPLLIKPQYLEQLCIAENGYIEDCITDPQTTTHDTTKRELAPEKDSSLQDIHTYLYNTKYDEPVDKRAKFSSWGGKRAKFSSWGGKRAKFNSWGGKRYDDSLQEYDDKRAKFNNWGGKRYDDRYDRWGSKIADEGYNDYDEELEKRAKFNSWGGKRSELEKEQDEVKRAKFNSWGGKRSELEELDTEKRAKFNSWGGKRNEDDIDDVEKRAKFNSWGGKRDGSYVIEDKRAKFSSWGGKRSIGEVEYPYPIFEYDKKKFNSWGGKRILWDFLQGNTQRLPNSYRYRRFLNLGTKRKFSSWGGKRSDPLLTEVPDKRLFYQTYKKILGNDKKAFAPWGGKRDFNRPTKAFNSWGGKRSGTGSIFRELDERFKDWGTTTDKNEDLVQKEAGNLEKSENSESGNVEQNENNEFGNVEKRSTQSNSTV